MPTYVERRLKGEKKQWPVYTRKEADEKGFSYVYWKDAKVGEWALSDDDYVAECVYRRGPYEQSGHERYEIVLPFGRAFTNQTLGAGERLQSGNYYHSADRDWVDLELRRPRTQRVLKTYARRMLEHPERRLPEREMDEIGKLYRPKQKNPRATFKRLLKNDRVKTYVAKEIAALLREKGYTKGDVVDMYGETYELAKKEGHTGTMKSVADRFSTFLQMEPKEGEIPMEEASWEHLEEPEEPKALPATGDE